MSAKYKTHLEEAKNKQANKVRLAVCYVTKKKI